MKKLFPFLAFCLFMISSCGEAPKQKEEKSELSTEEEAAIVSEISSEVQDDTEQIKESTEESLQEIDSLLENF